MDILLVYPPWRQPFMPPFSLADLTGQMMAGGADCAQRDLNIEFFDHLLSRQWLDRTGDELANRIAEIEKRDELDGETALFHESMAAAALRLPALTGLVEDARRGLRQPERFYQLDGYRRSMRILEEALGLVFLAWSPCRQPLHGHQAAAGDLNCAAPKPTTDGEARLLGTLTEDVFIPSIAESGAGLIAVLADYRSQLLPAMTLLRGVRRLPGIHTAIAGWMAEELLARPEGVDDLEGVVDVLISGLPGGPMLRLAESLKSGRPGVLGAAQNRGRGLPPVITAEGTMAAENLPPPVYDGLPLDRYFSPETVLAVRASRVATDQAFELGRRHHCRRFLFTGDLDRKTATGIAAGMSVLEPTAAWFGTLGPAAMPDEALCRALTDGGCAKVQLLAGPAPPQREPGLEDQLRLAMKHGLPMGLGLHLHCRLDDGETSAPAADVLEHFFAQGDPGLLEPGFSFSCRVLRDGRRGPAVGGHPPDLYDDATAPVPGVVPGFGRDPGDDALPPESAAEERRWRLVRLAGTAMGPNRTPGTMVHDFLYLAHQGADTHLPGYAFSSPPILEPGMVLRPAPGMTRGRFRLYDPVTMVTPASASSATRFVGTGRRWWASPGDSRHGRPLPDPAMAIIESCDGLRTWEEALVTAGIPGAVSEAEGREQVRMMLAEGLLVRA